MSSERYRAAGVDIDAGNRAVEAMKPAIRATFNENVLLDVGAFGGLYALRDLPEKPVLVASTDGVGTKVKLAAQLEKWRSIGHDIVNHCVNDILVQNARPLFFLDYIASAQLSPQSVAEVVTGIAEACEAVGCALLGGETAEMPGVYVEEAFDLVGTVVGLVAHNAILPDTAKMQVGDRLVALPSSGPHTNGYSLIRQLIADKDLEMMLDDGQRLNDALLAPHRCYISEIDRLQTADVPIYGIAHITGGGIIDNLPRVLPEHLVAEIDTTSWELPPVFANLLAWADMVDAANRQEAFRVFNMGIGMILVMPPYGAELALRVLPEAYVIGTLTERDENAPQVKLQM